MVDAIDSGSTNGHRLIISPDGQRLYTENEEDGTVSVIDLPNRKLLGKIKTPRALAGIAISADGRTVVAVDDEQPVLVLIDTASGSVADEVRLEGVPKAAQIARYSPDNSLIGVTSLNSDTVSLIDPSFRQQTAIKVGSQPMDMAFRGDELVRRLPGRRFGPRHRYSGAARKGKLPSRQGLRIARVLLAKRGARFQAAKRQHQRRSRRPKSGCRHGLGFARQPRSGGTCCR